MAWKTAKTWKWGKNGKLNGKDPPAGQGQTMAEKWPLLKSGGSNSPWSEFWSEFPHFMGMGVVPAPSIEDFPKSIATQLGGLQGAHRWIAPTNGMSKKCPKMSLKGLKMSKKLSRGAENTIFGHFLDNFCLFGRCFCLVTLSNARPLQWEAYCDTNGWRTAIQMGGILKYFPFLRAQWQRKRYNTNWRHIAIQIGGVLQYLFER